LEDFHRHDLQTISSKQLGQSLSLTDAQVRKDLACFGQFGHPGVGYRVDSLIKCLRHILGTDKISNVLLMGAGNLGRALLSYHGFGNKGFNIVAVCDDDPAKAGRKLAHTGRSLTIHGPADLAVLVGESDIRIAMLAVPAAAAQQAAEQVVAAGVRAILNFAPVTLTLPGHVAVTSVDLAVHLEQLSFQLNLMATSGHG
jgi:redox-sensing transcriptional repressor